MPRVYSPEEAADYLKQHLPTWHVEENHITRTYTTGDWRLTLLAAGAIAFLAEAAFHHPDLTLEYPRLHVRLQTHDDGGITDKDFELARRIEALLTWQPAESDALEGYPDQWIR